ncbi:MAG TPA: hypothetical protein VIU12_03635 [Chryseolinea sp.]|jgi:hypothetical protein
MKKLIAFVAVCGFALAFAACGKKAETATSDVDSAAVEAAAPAAVDSAAADTTKTDTTKVQ